jgi:hypothetical protein
MAEQRDAQTPANMAVVVEEEGDNYGVLDEYRPVSG